MRKTTKGLLLRPKAKKIPEQRVQRLDKAGFLAYKRHLISLYGFVPG